MTKIAAATAVYLFADIETVPSQDPAILADIVAKHEVLPIDPDKIVVEPDGRLTDPAKIAADIAKKKAKMLADHQAATEKARADIDAEYRKTALDGASGHLVSIAWAFDEQAVSALRNEDVDPIDATWEGPDGVEVDYVGETIFSDGFPVEARLKTITEGEAEMLEEFFDELGEHLFYLAAAAHQAAVRDSETPAPDSTVIDLEPFSPTPIVVAHNADFDVRFIWQRAVALGVPVPAWWPINASKYDTTKVQDTMQMWAGHSGRIGLDRLCRALGVAGKTDIDGSAVWDAVRAGKIDQVVAYNEGDIRRLRSVHRRMRGLPVLQGDMPLQFKSETNYLGHVDLKRPLSAEEMDVCMRANQDRIAEQLGSAPTYVSPDAFVIDEATGTVRVIPTHAELTVTEKTEDGWTAEGVVVVDAPAPGPITIRQGDKTVAIPGKVYNPDAEPGEPVEAWQFPNGNRMVFDGRGNQIPQLQAKPFVDLPARCLILHGTWEEFLAHTDEPWMQTALQVHEAFENASYEELLDAQDFNGEQAERDAWNDMPAGER